MTYLNTVKLRKPQHDRSKSVAKNVIKKMKFPHIPKARSMKEHCVLQ